MEASREDDLLALYDFGVDSFTVGPVGAFVNYQQNRLHPMNIIAVHPLGRLLRSIL